MGLVGSIIGVVLGIDLSGALLYLVGNMTIVSRGMIVSLKVIILTLPISVFVSIIAGIIPVYLGSRLNRLSCNSKIQENEG